MAWAIKSPKHEVSRGLGVQIEPPDVHHPLITPLFFTQLVPRDPFVRETRKRTFTQAFTQAKFSAIAPGTSRLCTQQTPCFQNLEKPSVELASAKYGHRRLWVQLFLSGSGRPQKPSKAGGLTIVTNRLLGPSRPFFTCFFFLLRIVHCAYDLWLLWPLSMYLLNKSVNMECNVQTN
eukprot:g18176.t1